MQASLQPKTKSHRQTWLIGILTGLAGAVVVLLVMLQNYTTTQQNVSTATLPTPAYYAASQWEVDHVSYHFRDDVTVTPVPLIFYTPLNIA